MIYFLNIDGTTTLVKTEPVYQNSINANKLVVFAPFSAFAQVSATFNLPNGLNVQGGLMTRLVGNQELLDLKGNKYNAWALDLSNPITQYPGTVRVQFSISLGQGRTLSSYSTQFTVEKGTPSDLPDYVVGDDALDIFTQIKEYLSTINGNMKSALENGIAYVRYEAPVEDLINRTSATGISLYVVDGYDYIEGDAPSVPSITRGSFTVPSMTEYLTDAQIRTPGTVPYNDQNFFQYNTKNPSTPAGFVVELDEVKDVGILQFYFWSVLYPVTIAVSINETGYDGAYNTVKTFTLNKLKYEDIDIYGETIIVQVPINNKAKAIKVVQYGYSGSPTNGSYVLKGMEIYAPTYNGYYSIVQNNGNKYTVAALDSSAVTDILTEAQRWADGVGATSGDPQYNNNAKYWAEQSQTERNQAAFQANQSEAWANGNFNGQPVPSSNPAYNNNAKYWAGIVAQYNAKANKVGGFPVLVLGANGQPVIPSVFINQVDIKEYITITNESQLQTITAQVGDVALLVGEVNGEKTVKKSWILLGESDGERDWAVYGTSYATNAGEANYATNAFNAERVNGAPINVVTLSYYEGLVDKTGVYFVTLD
jgi:hypothetical protein